MKLKLEIHGLMEIGEVVTVTKMTEEIGRCNVLYQHITVGGLEYPAIRYQDLQLYRSILFMIKGSKY